MTIQVPNGLTLKGVTIEANTCLNAATAAVASSAMEVGKSIASEIVQELKSGNTDKLTSEGVDVVALQEAIKKGQRDNITGSAAPMTALLTGSLSGPMLMIGAVGLGATAMFGKASGDPRAPQYALPPLPMEYRVKSILSGRSYAPVGPAPLAYSPYDNARTYAPRYDNARAYAPTSDLAYARLMMTVGLLVVNLSAMLAMTCATPLAPLARDLASYVYGWAVALVLSVVAGVAARPQLPPPKAFAPSASSSRSASSC